VIYFSALSGKGNIMFFKVILSLFLVVAAPLSACADALADARKPVDRLNETLIAVMKGGKQLAYQGRYKKLEPVVKDTFEFEAVSQIALGSHWKKLDKPQKTAFMEKLTDLSVATYAAQFKEFGGESFSFDSSQDIKNGRMLLRYTFSAPKDKPIKFEYIVGQFNGQWQIINIIVDGISDLALKKAQYTSVIDREGFDSLLAKISQKIADYANNNRTT
jgi:phospholipid transport system substrate-binding protein